MKQYEVVLSEILQSREFGIVGSIAKTGYNAVKNALHGYKINMHRKLDPGMKSFMHVHRKPIAVASVAIPTIAVNPLKRAPVEEGYA